MRSVDLQPVVRAAVAALAADLGGVFGDRLKSLVIYGEYARPHPHPGDGGPGWGRTTPAIYTLALVERLDLADLERCAPLSEAWRRRNLATPLLMTPEEFSRALDAFPLEYGDIIATHWIVSGDDPFGGLAVSPADIRRACEAQAKSHLLHLREGFIEAGGRSPALARLIVHSAPALRALLIHVIRLKGLSVERDLASHAGTLGLNEAVVREVLSFDHPDDLSGTEAVRLFPEYLDTAEKLMRLVDRWSA
jgi:hypothetical protein